MFGFNVSTKGKRSRASEIGAGRSRSAGLGHSSGSAAGEQGAAEKNNERLCPRLSSASSHPKRALVSPRCRPRLRPALTLPLPRDGHGAAACSFPLHLLASSLQVYRGSVKEFPGFDASQDAEALYNAMKGFGTDAPQACHPGATPMSPVPH